MKGAKGGGAEGGAALQSPGCEATVTGKASLSADIKVSSCFSPCLTWALRDPERPLGTEGAPAHPPVVSFGVLGLFAWILLPLLPLPPQPTPPSSRCLLPLSAPFLRAAASSVVDRVGSTIRQREGRGQAIGRGYVTAPKSLIGLRQLSPPFLKSCDSTDEK